MPEPIRLTTDQALALRIRAQRLNRPLPAETPVSEIVEAAAGLQAQDLPAGNLSARPRGIGLTAEGARSARLEERSILRAWAMRGTLHLVSARDYAWLTPLLEPVLLPGSRYRLNQLGFDEDRTARAVDFILDILAASGPLTRAGLMDALRQRTGIQPEGQARIHLIYRAAIQGLVCHGPDQGSEPTFLLTRDWLGPLHPLPREEALGRLARRYLNAFAPASPRDFATWSGLSAAESRLGWRQMESELFPVELGGRELWMLESQRPWLEELAQDEHSVRLLPRFDTYLLGYQDRSLSVAPEHEDKIRGGGIIYPTLLVDGFARGTWTLEKRPKGIRIHVEPFEPLEESFQPQIQAEIEDIARFLALPLL